MRSQTVCLAFMASPLRGSASPPEAGKADFKCKKIKKLLAQFRKTRDVFHSEELFGLI